MSSRGSTTRPRCGASGAARERTRRPGSGTRRRSASRRTREAGEGRAPVASGGGVRTSRSASKAGRGGCSSATTPMTFSASTRVGCAWVASSWNGGPTYSEHACPSPMRSGRAVAICVVAPDQEARATPSSSLPTSCRRRAGRSINSWTSPSGFVPRSSIRSPSCVPPRATGFSTPARGRTGTMSAPSLRTGSPARSSRGAASNLTSLRRMPSPGGTSSTRARARAFERWCGLTVGRIVFDNRVFNHGRIIVFERDDGVGPSAVAFSESFGRQLLVFLKESFRRTRLRAYEHDAEGDPRTRGAGRGPQLPDEERFLIQPPSDAAAMQQVADEVRESSSRRAR